ncbi:MAG: hypothetical protein JO061_18290, partial [Acidobacteriaceae bacterium]|nr:hypothetical protein [Acidobacteriaceae bacterium]
MRTFETDEFSDLELREMLASWTVPDPSPELRARVFAKARTGSARIQKPAFEFPATVETPWYGGEGRAVGASVLIHAGVVGLLLLIFQSPQMKKMVQKVSEVYFVPAYKPKLPPAAQKAGGGGGGGMHEPKPVVRGEAPKPALKQFMPPALAVEKPKLPQVPTITAPAPPILADTYGDPLSKALDVSGGPGSQGLGQGHGGGVGSG